MNIGGLPQMLIAWFRHQGADQIKAEKAPAGPEGFKSGQTYEGQVTDLQSNGRSLVRVGRELLDMQLPQQFKVGDKVRLTYVTDAARPTFVLEAGSARGQVQLSPTVQQVNALLRHAQSPAETGAKLAAMPDVEAEPLTARQAAIQAAQVASQTSAGASAAQRPILPNPAALLNAATTLTQTATPANTLASVIPGQAIPGLAAAGQAIESARAALASHAQQSSQGIVSHSSPEVAVMGQRLKQTLSESGLFYENHLGRMVKGELSLDAIQREPQARMLEGGSPRIHLPGLDGVPDDAARLAGRQLLMLDGGPFAWLGLAWPGQKIAWMVEERPDEQAAGDPYAEKWVTQLRMTLPRLGEVMAELGVGPYGLRVAIKTTDPVSEAEMSAALPQLVAQMQQANLNLTQLKVERVDAEPGDESSGDGRA